jgi:hypothetical protein
MVHAKPKGPIQGTAKRGFDAPYEAQTEAAQLELESTLVGPKNSIHVPKDDIYMKNPDGDLLEPSALPVNKQKIRPAQKSDK